jgi:UDP-3-O-[3-hydroxymyristoyl] N-acetylglucosamine deacetylase/3-hydroxyacyl-[acyl-carrier-protein] dehydratase
VQKVERATTIAEGSVKVQTVEHVLSALTGMGVDNAIIEMDANEPPIADGSALPFVELIKSAGIVEQSAYRKVFEIREPIYQETRDGTILHIVPDKKFRISCTNVGPDGRNTQYYSTEITPEIYEKEIAPARTFVYYEDVAPLAEKGLIKGGTLEAAVVIRGDTLLSKHPLRFNEEFARHKILDIIGDLSLLGLPLKAHIVATRPGHAINAELTKALAAKLEERRKGPKRKARSATVLPTETSLDIRRILDTIPHRYPFVMIDRVLEFIGNDELVAIKNVTINEPYFTGHFPTNPVMPGVLQLEAMAQAAGIVMLRRTGNSGKTAFFMSADKVKFRRPVRPGDQIIINAKITKCRGDKLAAAECNCTVGGQVVSSAELMFAVVEEGEE